MGLKGNINENGFEDLTPGRPGVASPAIDTTAASTAYAQQVNGQTQAPSWGALDQLSVAEDSLSPDAQEYLTKLSKDMQEYARRCRLSELTVTPLNDPAGAYVITSGGYARVILFAEAVASLGPDLPTVLSTLPALDHYKTQSGTNIKPVPPIVIHPADYKRVTIMAKDIVKTFLALQREEFENFNLYEFQKSKYDFDFSKETFDRYIAQNDPHGVPPRADLTLVMTRDEFNKDAAEAAKIANTSYDRSTGYVRKVCFVVGAYVDFIATGALQGPQYIPEIHISYIDSNLPVGALVPMAISVAVQAWAQSGKWFRQYEDLRDGKPNLGVLFFDKESNLPGKITSLTELEECKNNYIYRDPSVVIDVPLGRAMPAGLALYGNVEDQKKLIDTLNKFFMTNDFNQFTNAAAKVQYNEIIGYASTPGNVYIDSRYCDYLNLASQSPQTAGSLTPLLNRSLSSNARIRILQEKTNTSIIPLYMEEVVSINAELLAQIQARLGGILTSTLLTGSVNTIDPNMAIQNANALRGITQSAYAQPGFAQNVSGYVAGNMGWY